MTWLSMSANDPSALLSSPTGYPFANWLLLRLPHTDAIATASLGFVQSLIGSSNQSLSIREARVRHGGHASAHRHGNVLVLDEKAMARHGLANTFGNGLCLDGIGASTNGRELFTADTREHVFGPNQNSYCLSQFGEDLIAGRVPVRVVDGLEMVYVEHHQRQVRLGPCREGELAFEAVGEILLVERFREVIAQCRFVHLALEDLVEAVVVGELEHRARSDEDLVAVFERVAVDA